MKIKENDTVLITSGKYRGKRGKILISFPKENRILVDGINLRKKHQKPKSQGQKGQIIEKPSPISVSNVKLVCPKCGQPTRVGYLIHDKKKFRVCKKCEQEI